VRFRLLDPGIGLLVNPRGGQIADAEEIRQALGSISYSMAALVNVKGWPLLAERPPLSSPVRIGEL
jgi:hypothetical protein